MAVTPNDRCVFVASLCATVCDPEQRGDDAGGGAQQREHRPDRRAMAAAVCGRRGIGRGRCVGERPRRDCAGIGGARRGGGCHGVLDAVLG